MIYFHVLGSVITLFEIHGIKIIIYCKFLVLAQDEADKKGLSQKEVADNNQGKHEIDVLSMHDLGPC